MILTDRKIRNALKTGLIDITPQPAAEAYSSTTVDFTLAPILRVFRRGQPIGLKQTIDPSEPGFKAIDLINGITDRVDIDPVNGYLLPQNTLIIGWTVETIHLKDDSELAARVEGKSSLARVGLAIHVTAPIIHTGFRAPITLEMINLGPMPVCLRSGMRICQIVFEKTLGKPDRAYKGQFMDQKPS